MLQGPGWGFHSSPGRCCPFRAEQGTGASLKAELNGCQEPLADFAMQGALARPLPWAEWSPDTVTKVPKKREGKHFHCYFHLCIYLFFTCPTLKRTNETARRGLNAEGQHSFLAGLWWSASPEERLSLTSLLDTLLFFVCRRGASGFLCSLPSGSLLVSRPKRPRLQAPGTSVAR